MVNGAIEYGNEFSLKGTMSMKVNHLVQTSPEFKEATPAQAGTFSLASLGLRLASGLGYLAFNYSPVGGLATFAGARVRTGVAYLLPVALMVVTDLVLWAVLGTQYSPLHPSRPFVYGSFLLYVLLGRLFARYGLLGLGCAATLGSVQFFLITNFSSWLRLAADGVYSYSLEGLMAAYAAGVPFYHYTLLSDLGYTFTFVAVQVLWTMALRREAETQEASVS